MTFCITQLALVVALVAAATRGAAAAGSCTMAGYTSCCSAYTTDCAGDSGSCYCDEICYALGDCCSDTAGICSQPDGNYLSFLPLDSTTGVSTITLPSDDDGSSNEIPITTSFPFGNVFQTSVYVITNGYLSFGQSYTGYIPVIFPQRSGTYFLVAPFFTDIDISRGGMIRYEVHTSTSSSGFLADVSNFIRSETGSQFTGQWMLLAEWYNVPPFGGPYDETNTFQAVVITNGTESHALFTYQCGSLDWSNGATIGFSTNTTYNYFANHRLILSENSTANQVACLNYPTTVWSNVLYQIGLIVGTPTIVSTVPLSSTTVVIAWEPQSGIDHYVVAFEYVTESQQVPCTGYEYNNTVTADGNDTQVTLTGLQEYFVYTFSLYAVVNGPGGAITSNSATGGFATLQAAPGSAPQNLSSTSTDKTEITIEWATVVCIDHNGEITGYIVRCGVASSDQREEKVVPGTSDNGGVHTITGLTPYTNYSIEVAAVNSDGDTGPFAAITVETLQDRPGVVGTLSVTHYPTSLQIIWSAPLVPNGFIIAYEVKYYLPESGMEGTEQNTTYISTTHTLKGLRPQTTYTVTVRAYTIVGSGEERTISVTTEAIPQVEGIWYAVFNDTTVAVLWSPTSVPEVAAYIVSYSPASDSSSLQVLEKVSNRETSVIIYNLAPTGDEEYQFQVQAVVEIDGEEFISKPSTVTGSTKQTDPTASEDNLVAPITGGVVAVVLVAAVAVTIIVIAWMVIRSRRHYSVQAAATAGNETEMNEYRKSMGPADIPTLECSAYGTPTVRAHSMLTQDDNHVYEVVGLPPGQTHT